MVGGSLGPFSRDASSPSPCLVAQNMQRLSRNTAVRPMGQYGLMRDSSDSFHRPKHAHSEATIQAFKFNPSHVRRTPAGHSLLSDENRGTEGGFF